MTAPIRGTAAGVPYLAYPPQTDPTSAPFVILWHLMDPPATPAAFASALPLHELEAWRIYLELPLTGERLPEGGYEELMRRGYEDAVLQLQGPIARQGVDELPAALAALREQLGADGDRVALVGGSMGSAIATLATLEQSAGGAQLALVTISPISRLRDVVNATAAQYGFEYPWSGEADRIAATMDFVARAGEIGVPLQIVVGSEDDKLGVVEPASELHNAVGGSAFVVIEGMAHALAEPPGIEPAPQTAHAAQVDDAVTKWLSEQLS